MEGTYEISIRVTHVELTNTDDPAAISPVTFTVKVVDNPCTADMILPSDDALDFAVYAGIRDLQTIPLPGFVNGDCVFSIDMTEIDAPWLSDNDREAVFNATETITQPLFESTGPDEDDRVVEV